MKEKVELKPKFAPFNNNGSNGLEKAETFLDHIQELTDKEQPTPHAEILIQLLEQIKEVDFEALVFPQVVDLRKKLKKLEPESDKARDIIKELEGFKLTNKHYLVLSIENVIKVAKDNQWGLCKNHDFIYLYNGAYWATLDKETFQKFLGEAAEKMGVAKYSARHYLFREQLYKQFLATAYLPTPVPDKDTVLINLENGTFEIGQDNRELRQFNSADFLTYQLPFEYSPNAMAPMFETYLNRVLPDKQRQKVLAEYLGYVFIKNGSNALKEEKALILYGGGANGKSVFFEVVNALLGPNNVSIHPLELLTDPERGAKYRAELANKLVNYASEINGRLEASIFKQMVSGEKISARLLYGQPFELEQYAKLIFNCNELPKDVEHTNAYFRRFLIIPFDVTIPEHEQDKKLHTKIISQELSGVFNWVLEGLNRLLKQSGFSECEAAKKALEQYKTESNSIKLFLDDNDYQTSATSYKLIKELYPEYRTYCQEDGMNAFKKINFSKQLETLGIQVDREPGTGQKIAYLKNGNNAF